MSEQKDLFDQPKKEWSPFDGVPQPERIAQKIEAVKKAFPISDAALVNQGLKQPPGKLRKQVIAGNPPSKSNRLKIITFKSKDPNKRPHASLAKSTQTKDYERGFQLQCNKYRNANIQGHFQIEMDVYFPHDRSDLDNALKVVLDCLQVVGAIVNDKNCTRIVAQKFLDKLNPRIEFTLTEIFP